MHLLIILLQQLLGMLPGSKQVPQPEVVRKNNGGPQAGEPDACARIAPPLFGWMTPFESLYRVTGRRLPPASSRWRVSMAALRAHRRSPADAGARRPRN